MTDFIRDEAVSNLESALDEGQGPEYLPTQGYGGSVEPVKSKDVAHVIAVCSWTEEGYAECTVMGVVLFNDGRYAYVEGGCDTTGWDCRSNVRVCFASSLNDVIRWGMTDESREKLPEIEAAATSGMFP